MKPSLPPEYDEQDRELIKLLQMLGSLKVEYPAERLAARRAAYLEQLKHWGNVAAEPDFDLADREIVGFLTNLKSDGVEYPAELLAARRAAFLQQIERPARPPFWGGLWPSLRRLLPAIPSLNMRGLALVSAALLILALIGSALFRPADQQIARPTLALPTRTDQMVALLCPPQDQTVPCAGGVLDDGHDLADPGNGLARPAVSKDARTTGGALYKAAYVNDGRNDTSWVSNSPNSWVKIDLGKVTTINTVTVRQGSAGSSSGDELGPFVIAVAQSEVYSDGSGSTDYTRYAQVFSSEGSGLPEDVSPGATVRTQFPAVKARYVKLTFQKAGAAIGEVGVFRVPAADLIPSPTPTAFEAVIQATATLLPTETLPPTDTGTPFATGTFLPTETLWPTQTDAPTDAYSPMPTDTALPSETPTPLPTDTLLPTDTGTALPTDPLPSDTPLPLPTIVLPTSVPPTEVPATSIPPSSIPPTIQSLPSAPGPIVISGHDQNLTLVCNGEAIEVKGHDNTVLLLGTCSSITVSGNHNHIFWEFGSPVIRNTGKQNTVNQK